MREVEESEATPLPVGGHDTPINPYVMREFNNLNDRINMMRETMQAMYNRLNPAAQFYDWVKETHPDLLNQYVSIRELEEAGKDYGVALKMGTHPYAQAIPKASGQAVKYEVGNGTL